MISVSPEAAAYIEGDSRRFRIGLSLSGGLALECDVINATFYRGACGDSYIPGAMYIPYAEITATNLVDPGVTLAGEVIHATMTIVFPDGSTEDIPYGTYFCSSAQEAAGKWTIKLSGQLSTLTGTYTSELTYPATISAILGELQNNGIVVTLQGITTTTADVVEKSLSGLTYQNALTVLAGLLGGFVTEDVTAGVVIAAYGSGSTLSVAADRSITPPDYKTEGYQVTGLTCIVSEDTEDEEGTITPGVSYTYGSPVNVTVQNGYMTEALFNKFARLFVGQTFEPATVNMNLGDPRIDPWDVLEVDDIDGVTHAVQPLNVKHYFDGGLTTTVDAPIKTDAEGEVTVVGPLAQAIKNLSKDVNTVTEEVKKVADNNKHFFYNDESGVHVTMVENQPNQGKNVLINSNGMAVRDGTSELAIFTDDMARVGAYNERRVEIGTDGILLYAGGNIPLFKVKQATSSLAAEYKTEEIVNIALESDSTFTYSIHNEVDPDVTDITLSIRGVRSGSAIGFVQTFPFWYGTSSTATGMSPISTTTIAYDGDETFTVTTGTMTEGVEAKLRSIEYYSLSAPTPAVTLGVAAPGNAEGAYSTRGGYYTSAVGANAAAFGKFNDADQDEQFVVGRYNASNSNAAFIIGNGTDSGSNRSNAFSVDWDGTTSQRGNATYDNNRGVLFTDANGNTFPGIIQNTQNLWIGAQQTAATHHVGYTYISSGYDGSAGNETIYVCVPNSTNTGGTNYGIYHAGYKPTGVLTQTYSSVACTNRSGSGAYYSGNLTLPSGIPSGAAILSVMISNFSGAAASFSVCFNGTRLFLISDVSQTITSVPLRFCYQL